MSADKKNGISPRPARLSLRYKLTLPVLIFVSLMLFLLFQTTFQLVRELVVQRNESRLKAMADVFAEMLKDPVREGDIQDLKENVEWMTRRPDVLEVRVENREGNTLHSLHPDVQLPPSITDKNFLGALRISQDTYVVAVPLKVDQDSIGRVLIVFFQRGFEEDLRQIFEKRLMIAFIMLALLGVVTTGVTWLAIRPLFNLKKTAERILAGDLSARASVNSFDEIADLAGAFNEMVSRLGTSFERLRTRTEALRESEEKYRLIVENSSDVIGSMNPEGEIVFLNRGFSGYSRQELLKGGLPFFASLNTEDSRKRLEESLKAIMEKKEPVLNVQITNLHRLTGSEIYYLADMTPLLDSSGNVKLIQGSLRDVTELHQIELMKESLIRDVAHELKNPVAKFEMTLNLLEKEFKEKREWEKYHDLLGIMKNNTSRLMMTINDIMDLSKLEAGADKVALADLNLNEVLSQVFLDMQMMVLNKKLSFECRLAPEPLLIKGDQNMLYRLFTNIIANALKFTQTGKISISSEKTKDEIYVKVSDTGIGISKEDVEAIFEPFVQKTASTPGIGVGLAISRRIAYLHGGKVWAESDGMGKGSTFFIKLPLLETRVKL